MQVAKALNVVGKKLSSPPTFPKRAHTDYIVIHCAATPAHREVTAAEIRQWHLERKPEPFKDIGYHFVIRRSGLIEKGRPFDVVGAHAAGYNSVSLGICLAGGLGRDKKPSADYTSEQWASLRRLVTAARRFYPTARVVGHCDLDPKGKPHCPGFNVAAWWGRQDSSISASAKEMVA